MDIPINADTFGIIHSDFHTSNYMLEQLADESWEMTAIDFDNAQKSWYILDIGTVCFEANKQLDANKELIGGEEAYQTALANFKDWIIEGYGMEVDRTELTEACEWRMQFEYYLRWYDLETLDPTSDAYKVAQEYVDYYHSGMPTC